MAEVSKDAAHAKGRGARAVDHPALESELRRIANSPRLLVALDFDGTLSPHVDDPRDARAVPEARRAVAELSSLPETPVTLVSGRSVESLREVAQVPDSVIVIGSHGVEIQGNDSHMDLGLTEDEQDQLRRLTAILEDIAWNRDGVWVEFKPAGRVLHTRLASIDDAAGAQEAALSAVQAELTGVTIRSGKNVLEFSVRATTKGNAIEHLRNALRASAVFYAGDDVTDEDVFAVLGPDDLSLKCGTGDTIARQRVAEPTDVAEVLLRLLQCRRRHLGART
jgi:trehalose 6-phosphate phosphatase